MDDQSRDVKLLPLLLPAALSVLVLCITGGYLVYRFFSERAYRARWKEYEECGL